MPTGTRIRANNVFGTITDNPLTIGATSLNSANLALLPAVSSAHAIITLDPLRANGAPEIIIVTAHTASATVATITRGAYGTTARQHPESTVWVHAPIDEDFTEVLTSGTRPSDPYRGQMIFETDTNSFVTRDTSDAWKTAVPLAWTAWTPTLSNLTISNGSIVARYQKTGRTVRYRVQINFGSTTAMSTAPRMTMPDGLGLTTASFGVGLNAVGQGVVYDDSTGALYAVIVVPNYTTDPNQFVFMIFNSGAAYLSLDDITSAKPMASWAVNDRLSAWGEYETIS